MSAQILRLNKAGQAIDWVGLELAACLYTRNQVIWGYGDQAIRMHGGFSRMTGERSFLDIAPVIATDGLVNSKDIQTPHLCNTALFRRDAHLCMYCGKQYHRTELTRDHVYPRARGGKDSWENCVAACRPCNNHKGCRTPEESGIKLLAIPFKPNKSEYLAMANRNILADQMTFLTKGFSKNMQFRDFSSPN